MKITNMKQLTKNKKKIAPKQATPKKKMKIIAVIALFILLVVLFTFLINKTVLFFRENTIISRNPIEVKFYQPVEIVSLAELQRRETYNEVIADITNQVIAEYQQPLNSVKITEKGCQITSQIDPKTFFDIVAVKESGNNENDNPRALHNICKAKGLYNAIGYSPNTKFCFKDEQEARLFMAYWVKKNCDGKTMAQCQCFYNTGTWVDTCPYYENNLSLAN